MIDPEDFSRSEATRRRVAFLGLEGGILRLEVREPASSLVKALAQRGFAARAEGPFILAVEAEDWAALWHEAGPLLDCGC